MNGDHFSAKDLEEHIPGLRRFARALLRGDQDQADDLVQDTLEAALARWHQLRSDRNLRTWVYTILYHRFLTNRQRRLRRRVWFSSLTTIPEEDLPVIDGGQEQMLVCSELLRGFAELPEEQRSVLLLVGVDGFTYDEAARILEVPIGTVMSRLSRGRERLRQYAPEDRTAARGSPPTASRPARDRRSRRPRPVPAIA